MLLAACRRRSASLASVLMRLGPLLASAALCVALASIAHVCRASDIGKLDPAYGKTSLVRLDAGAAYVRGTELVGFGSKKSYTGSSGSLGVGAELFLFPAFGFELEVDLGNFRTANVVDSSAALLRLGVDLAPIRWKGRWGGSIAIAGGGTMDAAKHVWLYDGVRVFPYAGVRFDIQPSDVTDLRASYDYVPISTGALDITEHHVELAMCIHYVQFGLRAGSLSASGGDPGRKYGELSLGSFIAAAFRY